MAKTFEERCQTVIQSLHGYEATDIVSIERLTGGVASDIAVVHCTSGPVCVKFALSKLQVNDDWYAPVHRSRAEYCWLKLAGTIVPGAAPRLYGWSDTENGFAMEFIDGHDTYLWKSRLLAGGGDHGEAAAVADVVGRIHAASTDSRFDQSAFQNAVDFESLRLAPYLRFTGERHPDLAPVLRSLADKLHASSTALIHGDISPKNVLIRAGRPVILDAECATMGDPVFDIAFCLNHLVLKSIHLPGSADNLREAVRHFWHAYQPHVNWEPTAALEARLVMLLPALMLARIDGKSPVEYLTPQSRERVRKLARSLILQPADSLDGLIQFIDQENDA